MISKSHPVLTAMRAAEARTPELAAAREAVESVFTAADRVIEEAERDGHNQYCVAVETMDALSAELTRAGGAS